MLEWVKVRRERWLDRLEHQTRRGWATDQLLVVTVWVGAFLISVSSGRRALTMQGMVLARGDLDDGAALGCGFVLVTAAVGIMQVRKVLARSGRHSEEGGA